MADRLLYSIAKGGSSMRLQSKAAITVNGKVIGGPAPLVCLPLVAGDTDDLLEQARELLALSPDLLEWRIDGFDAVENLDVCLDALKKLRHVIGSTPLIFTCRIHAEGGMRDMPQDIRLKLIEAVIATRNAEIVDIELCNETSFVETVKRAAESCGVRVILSYHDFTGTPSEAVILEKLTQAQAMGGDIAKVAVMPRNYHDVLTLLSATLEARSGAVSVPLVTMSMGSEGGVTRLAGGVFGSDITFAVGRKSSAPGQIPIQELRRAMAVLYE